MLFKSPGIGTSFGFSLAIAIATLTGPTRAAVFDDFDDDRNSRFLSGEVVTVDQSIEANEDFLINANAITGVGLNRATLITQQHYITADHAPTATPLFRGSDGIVREYSTIGSTQISRFGAESDIRIYTLATPIPTEHGVRPIPIYSGSSNDLIGEEIIVFASGGRAGRNVVETVDIRRFDSSPGRPTIVAGWEYNTTEAGGGGLGGDEIGLTGGDSGHSVLINQNGQLSVIGANFGIIVPDGVSPGAGSQPYTSFASFLQPYTDQINEVTMQQGFRLRMSDATAVPEPSSFALVAILGTPIACRFRRLRRRPRSDRRH